jgi:hypothetical protein
MKNQMTSNRSWLAWVLLSPLALFMALISTIKSDVFYYVQLVLFGCWSLGGVVNGIGKRLNAGWATSLEQALTRIAFAYFGIVGVLIAYFLIAAIYKGVP